VCAKKDGRTKEFKSTSEWKSFGTSLGGKRVTGKEAPGMAKKKNRKEEIGKPKTLSRRKQSSNPRDLAGTAST